MTTLFSSDIYRLVRSKAALFGMLGAVAFAAGIPLASYCASVRRDGGSYEVFGQNGVEILNVVSSILIFWLAVFVAFFAAAEFQHGTVRNGLALGKSRVLIYFSKFLCTVMTLALAFLTAGVAATLANTALCGFGDMAAAEFVPYFAMNCGMWLLYALPYAAVFCAIAFICRSPALTVALGVAFMFTMSLAAQGLLGYVDAAGPLNIALRAIPMYYSMAFGYLDIFMGITTVYGAGGQAAFFRDSAVVCAGYVAAACAAGCFAFARKDVK
ncbi:MAG: ABC transporter permease [Clostridiales bacterium]|jgi:ABC-2 type transport system permease protein|nr:ABC transporter permease [Clostridiales bacterium]